MELWDRMYSCENCGYVEDRDVNAAINILQEWIKKRVPPEQREFTPVEIKTSDLLSWCSISQVLSVKQKRRWKSSGSPRL